MMETRFAEIPEHWARCCRFVRAAMRNRHDQIRRESDSDETDETHSPPRTENAEMMGRRHRPTENIAAIDNKLLIINGRRGRCAVLFVLFYFASAYDEYPSTNLDLEPIRFSRFCRSRTCTTHSSVIGQGPTIRDCLEPVTRSPRIVRQGGMRQVPCIVRKCRVGMCSGLMHSYASAAVIKKL